MNPFIADMVLQTLTFSFQKSWYIKDRIYFSTLTNSDIDNFKMDSFVLGYPDKNKTNNVEGVFLKYDAQMLEMRYHFPDFEEHIMKEKLWYSFKYNFIDKNTKKTYSNEVLLRAFSKDHKPAIENTNLEATLNFLMYKVINEVNVFKKQGETFTNLIEYLELQDINSYKYFDTFDEMKDILMLFNKFTISNILKQIFNYYENRKVESNLNESDKDSCINFNDEETKLTATGLICKKLLNILTILKSFNMNENSSVEKLFLNEDLSSVSIMRCLIIKVKNVIRLNSLKYDYEIRCKAGHVKSSKVIKITEETTYLLLGNKKFCDGDKLFIKISLNDEVIGERSYSLE